MKSARQTDGGKPSIALVGLRGCGKSTVGRELARLLGGDCIDTDELIVQRAGKSIADIFKDEGEAGFRRRERDAVAQAAAGCADPPESPLAKGGFRGVRVIGVGGGAVLDVQNVRVLKQVSRLVWLTASPNELWTRISSDCTTAEFRPPLTDRTGLQEVELLLAERSPIYEQAADLIIDTERRTPAEVAQAIVARLNRDVDDQ